VGRKKNSACLKKERPAQERKIVKRGSGGEGVVPRRERTADKHPLKWMINDAQVRCSPQKENGRSFTTSLPKKRWRKTSGAGREKIKMNR